MGAGFHFVEDQRLKTRDRLEKGFADIRLHRLEGDLPQELADQQGRLLRLALKNLLQVGHPLLDPFAGRDLENRVGGLPQGVQLPVQRLGLFFRVAQGIPQRLAPPSVLDKLDHVFDLPSFFPQGGFLLLDLLGDGGAHLRHQHFHPLQNVEDVLGLGEPFSQGSDDDALGNALADHQLVLATAPTGFHAPVIAAALPAHLSDGRATQGADHSPREKLLGKQRHPASLLPLVALSPLPPRPDPLDLRKTRLNLLPDLLWNDSQLLVDRPMQGPFWAGELPLHSRARVQLGLGLPPRPHPDVLFVLQNARDGAGRPGLVVFESPRHSFNVQPAHDGGDRLAFGELIENPANQGSLFGDDLHLVAVGSGTPLFVQLHFPRGAVLESKSAFSQKEPPLLLPLLAPQGFLLEVREVVLVHDSPELVIEFGILVGGAHAIGHRVEVDPSVFQLADEGEKKEVLPRNPGEVVHQQDLKPLFFGRLHQGHDPCPIGFGSRGGLVAEDEFFINDMSFRLGVSSARRDLVGEAFDALVV